MWKKYGDPAPGRACSGCRVCCVSPALDDLSKPMFEPCSKLVDAGCGIYAERPLSCRSYECTWKLLPEVLRDDERPDKLGIYFVVSAADIDAFTREPITYTIDVWEAFPGGVDTNKAQKAIDRVIKWASRIPQIDGLSVTRFGETAVQWLSYPGSRTFEEMREHLTMSGMGAEPFRRRKPKVRLDTIT